MVGAPLREVLSSRESLSALVAGLSFPMTPCLATKPVLLAGWDETIGNAVLIPGEVGGRAIGT